LPNAVLIVKTDIQEFLKLCEATIWDKTHLFLSYASNS